MPPAIAGNEEIAIDDYLSRKLVEDLGGEEPGPVSLRTAIARYEQRLGGSALRSLVQQLVKDLDAHTTDLHRDLATLPFRLVLQATPDRMMFNAFVAAGKADARQACYDYCRGLSSDVPLSLPTSAQPIVFSLFGRHDRPESMVLTDKNLLDYLVRITRESPPLPDPVRATLRAPSTLFLFVGFGFTNWWLRLLLKVLDVTGVENRGLSLALEDSSSFTTASGENKGFFESAGIFIQAGDWRALAKELAAQHQENVSRKAADQKPADQKPQAEKWSTGRRPLVFLSYASEDADTVNGLRTGLEDREISVWQDSQNLRGGQNWESKIAEFIKRVDYFVFVQTENMDRRDDGREDGVYNRELKLALERAKDRPFGAVFVLHVTVGQCRPRSEPELAAIHRLPVDADDGVEALVAAIRESFKPSGDDVNANMRQA